MRTFNVKDLEMLKELIESNAIKIDYNNITNRLLVYVRKSPLATTIKKHLIKDLISMLVNIEYVEEEKFNAIKTENSYFTAEIVEKPIVYKNWKDLDWNEQLMWIRDHKGINPKNIKEFKVRHNTFIKYKLPTVCAVTSYDKIQMI